MISLKIDKGIVESDKFLDMPKTTQLLFFLLLLDTDVNGVIRHPKTIVASNGFGADDFRLLHDKGFVGSNKVDIYITDWKQR